MHPPLGVKPGKGLQGRCQRGVYNLVYFMAFLGAQKAALQNALKF
jgi:hypothetical protein